MSTEVRWDQDRFRRHGASAVVCMYDQEVSGLVDVLNEDGSIVVSIFDEDSPENVQGTHTVEAKDVVKLTYGDE